MSGKQETTRELRVKLCDAGRIAAKELITVAKMSIFSGKTDGGKVVNEDLAAEKMKLAAQAKKVAIMDAFDILAKVDEEERKMAEEDKKELSSPELAEEKEKKKEKLSDFQGVETRTT